MSEAKPVTRRFQFTLRKLFAWVVLFSAAMAVLRRPIQAFFIDHPEWATRFGGAFLNPFRHLAWLAGWDVEYAAVGSDASFFGLFLGIVVSICAHIFLIFLCGCAIGSLLDWADSE